MSFFHVDVSRDGVVGVHAQVAQVPLHPVIQLLEGSRLLGELLHGIARTEVIAGTATAVSGRVQRRRAVRFAERDARIYAEREQAHEHEQPVAQAPPPPAPSGQCDTMQLRDLAELKAQGVLTDEEFAAQKARILGS